MAIAGSIMAFFGLDPSPAVKGMNTAKKAVRTGSKEINSNLRYLKRVALSSLAGWGVQALGKHFVQAAMDMDSMRRSMAAAVGGMEKGRREMNYLRKTSLEMGLSFRDSGKDFKMLAAAAKGTALEGDGVRKVWRSLQNATVALQLTTAETSGTVYAFKDMLSKGTVQAEELKRQLGNRLPGAFKMAADAMGLTTKELAKQMKLGNIMADEFLPALAKAMDETYAGSAVEASKSMRSELTRMKSAWFDFQATFMESSGLSEVFSGILKGITKVLRKGDDLSKWAAKIAHDLNVGIIWPLDLVMTNFIKASEYAAKFGAHVKYAVKYLSLDSAYVKMKYGAQILWWDIQNFFREGIVGSIKIVDDTMSEAGGPLFKGISKMFQPKKNEMLENFKKDTQATNQEISKLQKQMKADLKALSPMSIEDLAEETKRIEKEYAQKMAVHSDSIAGMYKDNSEKLQKKISAIATKNEMPDVAVGVNVGEMDTDYISKWAKVAADLEKMWAKSNTTAKNIKDAFTSAFNGIGDALGQMITKGKVDWSSLADSMISDMARIAVKQAVMGPLMAAFSAGMKGMFSTPSAALSYTPVATSINQGSMPDFSYASGGMINETVLGVGQTSGKSYSIGENESEMVLNQDQIRNLSARKSASVNVQPVINISTPPGTQATTQQSSDGMNMDILITAIESKLSSNMRRGSGLSDTMAQTFGLNRSAGAFR